MTSLTESSAFNYKKNYNKAKGNFEKEGAIKRCENKLSD